MSETEYSVDPLVWFSTRELPFTPKHFTIARSNLTIESKNWILANLRGRFSVTENSDYIAAGAPAFEDPQEAIIYELTWSA